MGAVDRLAPDERAVLALVVRQGRPYEEIARILGLPVGAVRGRAHAGVAALARDAAPGPDPLVPSDADLLLGQLEPGEAAAARERLEASPSRMVAVRAVQRALTELGAPAPGSQATEAASAPMTAPATPAPGAAQALRRLEATLRLARDGREWVLGGSLALVALVLVAFGLGQVLSRTDRDPADGASAASARVAPSTPRPSPVAPSTPRPSPVAPAPRERVEPPPDLRVRDALRLRSVGRARGTATLYLLSGRSAAPGAGERAGRRPPAYMLIGDRLRPTRSGQSYAVWLDREGARPQRLDTAGAVRGDRRLRAAGPRSARGSRLLRRLRSYDEVLVSRDASRRSTRPRSVILRARIPGRSGSGS